MVYGIVADVNDDAKSFIVIADQYITTIHATAECVAHCSFPDTPRWGNHKPLPTIGSFITVGGILNAVKRGQNAEVIQYEMDVETLSFLGKSSFTSGKHGMSVCHGSYFRHY